MKHALLPALALAFAAATPAQVGQPMPTLEVDAQFNLQKKIKHLDQLRGSAVFVEYWQTW